MTQESIGISNYYDELMEVRRMMITRVNSFYYNYLNTIDIIFDEKKVFYAGVTHNSYHYVLIINPIRFFAEPINIQMGILIHEIFHILFNHPITFANLEQEKANIATDLNINQLINQVNTSTTTVVGGFKKDIITLPIQALDLQRDYHRYGLNPRDINKDSLFYYDKIVLTKYSISVGSETSSIDPSISHEWDTFKGLGEEEKELMEGINNIKINSSLDPGNIPGELKDKIDFKKKKKTINWKKQLRSFISNGIYSDIDYSLTHVNKRFNMIGIPGKFEFDIPSILLVIDTSASISIEDLEIVYSELFRIHKLGYHIEVIECDTRIQRTYSFKQHKIQEYTRSISGRGGTDFNEPIKYFNKNRHLFGGCIYMTDGYASVPHVLPLGRFLWVLSSRRSKSIERLREEKFRGQIIKIE